MQAASVMQLNTGLARRCLVTLGMTAWQETEKTCRGAARRGAPQPSLTSEVLADRESAVRVQAVDGASGLGGRVVQGQRRRQHGLLTLPFGVQLLRVQRLREAEHQQGRQEE